MKKAIFTLAVLVMAFGNVGLAQRISYLKTQGKEIVFRHYGLRNDDIKPSEAIWKSTYDEMYRTTYTYDESDYWLSEELFEVDFGEGWIPTYLITYDYGFDGNVLVATVFENLEGDWMEAEKAEYTYGADMMEIVYKFMSDGQWENESKEVYNYNGDVVTILIWGWNGNNWSSSELYTYTFSDTTIEVLMQYMQGGAWQNEEKDTYTLDFDGNVEDILGMAWVNNAWENSEHTVYNYEDGVFVTKTYDKWYNGTWNEEFLFNFTYEDGNATHGSCLVKDEGNWITGDGDIEMAYNYNAESNMYCGYEVDVRYIDVTALKEAAQIVSFVVYPVPAENEIQIQAEGFQKAEIFTITGQMLLESEQNSVNVSGLAAGVYLLKVYDQTGNSATQKLVVK